MDSLCLGDIWVWRNWNGLILSIVPTEKAAGLAPCISILPASYQFVLNQPGLQFTESHQACV